tara:strand:+ start:1553 stop:2509 length:957 start_codon:yes stop_codon:yes gene_type:complete
MTNIGILWTDEINLNEEFPLRTDVLNGTYADFIKNARDVGAEVFIAPFSHYKDGVLTKAVTFNGSWKIHENIKIQVVLDKFPFIPETQKLRNSIHEELSIVNSPDFEKFCKDKLNTYTSFPDFVPTTLLVNDVKEYEDNLKHISSDKVVIKPRYGLDGIGVSIINKDDKGHHITPNTIIMDWVDTSQGSKSFGANSIYDVRCVLVNGEIDHAMVRSNDKGYLTNYYQGGKVLFIDNEDIPVNILELVKEIDEKIAHFNPRIYTADFMVDKSGKAWLIEMNSKPGLHIFQEQTSVKKIKEKQDAFHKNVARVLIDSVKQ